MEAAITFLRIERFVPQSEQGLDPSVQRGTMYTVVFEVSSVGQRFEIPILLGAYRIDPVQVVPKAQAILREVAIDLAAATKHWTTPEQQ